MCRTYIVVRVRLSAHRNRLDRLTVFRMTVPVTVIIPVDKAAVRPAHLAIAFRISCFHRQQQ